MARIKLNGIKLQPIDAPVPPANKTAEAIKDDEMKNNNDE